MGTSPHRPRARISLEPSSSHTMYLYVLLACVLWGLESHSVPMKIATVASRDNHTAVCAEIQRELMADDITYNGSFKRPQNTSEELCYGEFIKDFISTLKNISTNYNKDCHIEKVYKDMTHLTRICPKLNETKSHKKCTTETSNFLKFKEALQRVVISIEGWKSCKRIKGIL
uniref:Interleukin-4 n=1 Tax=Sus scrofa TaxID=9823 RepID=A0A8D1E6B8_PIG